VDRHFSSMTKSSRQEITYACSVPPFRRISALKSTSPSPVRRVSTGYVNYDGSDGHSTPSLRRHLFTLSSQLMWMATMPCWPGRLRIVTDRLQCVLNAAAHIVSGTRKFDRGLTHLLHSELHWLDVPERIQHKLGVTVHRCLQGKAPQYLIECCTPTSEVASGSVLPAAINSLCHVTIAASSAVGRSLLLVRSSVTHCLITAGTQCSALIVSSHA